MAAVADVVIAQPILLETCQFEMWHEEQVANVSERQIPSCHTATESLRSRLNLHCRVPFNVLDGKVCWDCGRFRNNIPTRSRIWGVSCENLANQVCPTSRQQPRNSIRLFRRLPLGDILHLVPHQLQKRSRSVSGMADGPRVKT